MFERPSFAAPLAILLLFVSFAGYIGAYAAMVQPRTRLAIHPDGCCRPITQPEYRAGGKTAAFVFAPLCHVDRFVRWRYWEGGTAKP